MILRLLCPRDYHGWMALQEGPEADGRHLHPDVDGLPGFDVKWLLKLDVNPGCAIFVGKVGSRATVAEDTVSADDHIALGNARNPSEMYKYELGNAFSEGRRRQIE
jgi:hypothetical protein